MRTMFFTASTILYAAIFAATGSGEGRFIRKIGPSLSGRYPDLL
jgi:hypothetical protein